MICSAATIFSRPVVAVQFVTAMAAINRAQGSLPEFGEVLERRSIPSRVFVFCKTSGNCLTDRKAVV